MVGDAPEEQGEPDSSGVGEAGLPMEVVADRFALWPGIDTDLRETEDSEGDVSLFLVVPPDP